VQVGQACEHHATEIGELVRELYPLGQRYALEVEPAYKAYVMQAQHTHSIHDVLRSVFEYSRSVSASVPSVEMARKEFFWRNGFFVWMQGTELHLQMLVQAGFSHMLELVGEPL
jgi:hypothetical protein